MSDILPYHSQLHARRPAGPVGGPFATAERPMGGDRPTVSKKSRATGTASVLARLAGALVVVFLVTLVAFLLSYLSPTDAAVRSFAEAGVSPTESQLAEKRAELGLDRTSGPPSEAASRWPRCCSTRCPTPSPWPSRPSY